MSRNRSQRTRATGRSSGFGDYERYALIPWEVATSEAYRALPDYAVRVLVALAGQCRKTNNGDISLTAALGKECGINRWKLYAGLELLERTGLIVKTRQGGMRPLGPTLYAVTWWPIVESKKYDHGVHWGLAARNSWASWRCPENWKAAIKEIEARQRGRGARATARKRTVGGLKSTARRSREHGPPAEGSFVPPVEDCQERQHPPGGGTVMPPTRPPGDGHL